MCMVFLDLLAARLYTGQAILRWVWFWPHYYNLHDGRAQICRRRNVLD